ncbi:hypothetical protein GCM10022221_42710 [Actinocorallia aurea]
MSGSFLFMVSLVATLVGLAASWGVSRTRGTASGMRGAAWSLVPLGLYLTGVTEFLWSLAFSPVRWGGVAVLALAGALYMVSGVRLRAGKAQRAVRGGQAASAPPAVRGGRSAPPVDDDMAEIEEILRRRGL